MHNHETIEGVKCVVNTCHYYQDGDHCSAGKIEIRPRNAKSSDQTDCVTFQPENSMK